MTTGSAPESGRRPWAALLLALLIAATLAGSGTYVLRNRTSAAPPSPSPASPSPSPTEDPEPPPPPPEPDPRLPNRQLKSGMKGPAVRLLQTMLKDLHYDVGPMDGRFGEDTLHALVAFQKVQGLERDGVVGASTRKALEAPLIPKPHHPKRKGVSIEVDITRQVVYVLRDGRIDNILDASTGGGYSFVSRGVQKVAITATGDYEVYLQYDGWYQSSVGPMYKSSFWLRGFAIHGALEVPPYPASHGCVRVTMSAIDRLWPELRLGTKISVYHS